MNRGRRTAFQVELLLLGGALALASPALAERLAVDAKKGQLSWAPSVGGGPVEEYRLKCGQAPGTYALPVVKFSPADTSAQISRVLPGPGKYFCAVTAANRYGESGPSNEVVVVLGGARADTDAARSSEPSKQVSATNRPVASDEFRIGPEDSLLISVWKNEALTRTVTVRPDGKISLPLVNDIPAAGLTPSELRTLVSNRLAEYVPTPNVAVIVTEVHSFKISVLGHVSRPGRFEVKSRTTVLEALSLAGGLDPFASRSGIVILRPDGNTTQRIRFDYSRAINRSGGFLAKIVNLGGGYQENFYLRPGDIVLVP
jgi:polysaccharide export outer membrane protein